MYIYVVGWRKAIRLFSHCVDSPTTGFKQLLKSCKLLFDSTVRKVSHHHHHQLLLLWVLLLAEKRNDAGGKLVMVRETPPTECDVKGILETPYVGMDMATLAGTGRLRDTFTISRFL